MSRLRKSHFSPLLALLYMMTTDKLDDIDMGILYYLQQDARNSTSTGMAESLDVAASTVRNRLERLEGEGIIKGYIPEIDYEKGGFQLHVLFTGTAPGQPDDIGQEVLEQEGVIAVRELLDCSNNLHIEAIGKDTDHITEIASTLGNMGIEITRSDLLKQSRSQPFNHFGSSVAEESY